MNVNALPGEGDPWEPRAMSKELTATKQAKQQGQDQGPAWLSRVIHWSFGGLAGGIQSRLAQLVENQLNAITIEALPDDDEPWDEEDILLDSLAADDAGSDPAQAAQAAMAAAAAGSPPTATAAAATSAGGGAGSVAHAGSGPGSPAVMFRRCSGAGDAVLSQDVLRTRSCLSRARTLPLSEQLSVPQHGSLSGLSSREGSNTSPASTVRSRTTMPRFNSLKHRHDAAAGVGQAHLLMHRDSLHNAGPRLARAGTLHEMEQSAGWCSMQDMRTHHEAPGDEALAATQDASAGRSGRRTSSYKKFGARSQSDQATAVTAAAAAGDSGVDDARGQQQPDALPSSKSEGSLFFRAFSGVKSMLSTSSQPSGPFFSSTLKKTAHTTLSTDGWTLHLVHCTDTALPPEQRRRYPVLMCPGLASSGPGTFDLLPKLSLVDFLASEGYDVWFIDIRGNGNADKRSHIDIEEQWNIDDYLVQDVPACIRYVLKQSGAEMLHWMGHSMGGMLGSGLCSQAGRWGRCLRSLSLLASGCFGDGSWHSLLKRLVVPITKFGFPAHRACQAMALLGSTPIALAETLFYWVPNMERPTRSALLSTCFNFIPERLVAQFLATHDSPTGLTSASGNFLYADPDVLAECKVPVLGVNGDFDLFCPATGGQKTVDMFGGPRRHITLGPANGQAHHYGHFDVVVGKNAQEEVWPHIKAFLDENDSETTPEELWDF